MRDNIMVDPLYSISDVEGHIKIIIKRDDAAAVFNSFVVETTDEYVDIHPMQKDGRLISFKNPSYSMSIECIKDMRLVELKVSSIQLTKTKNGEIVHRVYSHDTARYKNQRKFKRFSICDTGTLQFGDHHKALTCTVKDISYGGVGISLKGEKLLPAEEFLSLTFSHTQGRSITYVRAKCEAVRQSYNEDKNETQVGLKLCKENAGVSQIVNDVQRAELQKIRR